MTELADRPSVALTLGDVAGIAGGAGAVAISIALAMGLLFGRTMRLATIRPSALLPRLALGPLAALAAGFAALQAVPGSGRPSSVGTVALYMLIFGCLVVAANRAARQRVLTLLATSARPARARSARAARRESRVG